MVMLNHMSDGRVTRLATARSIRGLSHATLARMVGTDALNIFRWETGKEEIPTAAMVKRLALAMMWPWEDLTKPPLDEEDADERVLLARKAK